MYPVEYQVVALVYHFPPHQKVERRVSTARGQKFHRILHSEQARAVMVYSTLFYEARDGCTAIGDDRQ